MRYNRRPVNKLTSIDVNSLDTVDCGCSILAAAMDDKRKKIYAELDRIRESDILQERQLQILVILIDANLLNGRKLSQEEVVEELADEDGTEEGTSLGSLEKKLAAVRTQKNYLRNKLIDYYKNAGRFDPIRFIVAKEGFSLSIGQDDSPPTNEATQPLQTARARADAFPIASETSAPPNPVTAREHTAVLAPEPAVVQKPTGANSASRGVRAVPALLALVVGAVLAVAVLDRITQIRIIDPPNGDRVVRNTTVNVKGRGGRPWLQHYLVVEWQPYGDQPERFIQGGGPLHVDWTFQWNRDAFIGDPQTQDGSKFLIYVLSLPSANELKPGVDFDSLSGKLRPSYPRERSSDSISVFASIPGRQ